MKKRVFIILLVLIFTNYLVKPVNSQILEKSVSIKKNINNDNLKIKLLGQQNKDLRDFHEKIANTVYWALGFSAIFLVLFLGINIYFIRNRYNEEKEYLLQHINNAVHLKSNDLEKEQNKIIESIKKEYENTLKSFEISMSKIANDSIAPLKKSISNIFKSINALKIDIIDIEIKFLEKTDGCKDIIIRRYFDLAKEARKYEDRYWDWEVSQCLEEIEKLLNDGAKFDSGDFPEVTAFLDGLPERFKDSVHKVRRVIREQKTN